MDPNDQLPSLTSAPSQRILPNVVLQPPLSRRGHGPGILLILPEENEVNYSSTTLDPLPLQKWAEEGYAVVEIRVTLNDDTSIQSLLHVGIEALKSLPQCDFEDAVGLIVYDSKLITADDLATFEDIPQLTSMVVYGHNDAVVSSRKGHILLHLPGSHTDAISTDTNQNADMTVHRYPDAKSASFVIPRHPDFLSSYAAVAHSRTLTFLKQKMGGPLFDLECIWDEHTHYEFGDRSVEKTMGTMVQEPYVNHVPTMTGGIGRERLQNFYRYHFIWNNPSDTNLELISRTVGIDRVIDEFIFCFTHTEQIDWLIPGIPPTGKSVRLPMTSVVNIRGDRLYHEHIWWDQAGLLMQLGLMPEYLPFPYALPDGRTPAPGKRFEYRVPAAGEAAAAKLADENSVKSNDMLGFKVREVDDT